MGGISVAWLLRFTFFEVNIAPEDEGRAMSDIKGNLWVKESRPHLVPRCVSFFSS